MCDKNMTFEECELSILRNAVDHIENKQGKKKIIRPRNQKNYRNRRKFFKIYKKNVLWGNCY